SVHCRPRLVRGRAATLNGATGEHTRNFGDFCANDRSNIYLESFLARFSLERDRQRGRVRTVLAEGCRLGNSSIEKAHVMHWPRPSARRPRSVPLVRQHGQRVKLDSFLMQLLGLVRRGLPVNRAALELAVVHLARLFGKSPTNIIGVFDEMFAAGTFVCGASGGALDANGCDDAGPSGIGADTDVPTLRTGSREAGIVLSRVSLRTAAR